MELDFLEKLLVARVYHESDDHGGDDVLCTVPKYLLTYLFDLIKRLIQWQPSTPPRPTIYT